MVVGAVVGAIVLMVAGIAGVLLYRRHRRMRPKYMFEEPAMLEDKKGLSGTNGTSGTNGSHLESGCKPALASGGPCMVDNNKGTSGTNGARAPAPL